MPKKHKHHPSASSSSVDLRPRIERARQEGRFQQALDLSKQLHKYEPTPAHLELLKDVYLGRARQLRGQGHSRDALTVLDAALHLDGTTPAWLERLAEEMALCGAAARALTLLEKLPESTISSTILGHAADAALQQDSAGRASLPQALQADYDRVVLAFQQAENGKDHEARETMSGIGLRSPFLEWKVLLRGLQAYWNNDDVRAMENWQRLTPVRAPARLAAPFRCQIDAGFRAAQPPALQNVLQKQIDSLQGSTLLVHLRTLRATMANKTQMAAAFRQAEALLPAFRQEVPHLLPRLASCFYWAILESGPDDVMRYQRVFGHPPDDANFYRLHALGYERAGELALAHKNWQKYETEIAAHPEKWPGEQAKHTRALIWQRMGENAASIPPSSGKRRRAPFDLFGEDEPDGPLDPPAEKCFKMSLELAPDRVEIHEALVRHHLEEKREGKAEKAARQLLQHFPDHVPTLEMLSDLRRKHGDYADALTLANQALKGNPLDRRLRRKVGEAHLHLARSLVESGDFDGARRGFQTALELSGGPDEGIVRTRWAACEFKAGDPARAEELLQQAQATSPAVGVAYLLLTDIIRLPLARTLKTRFDREFRTTLADPPTAAGAVFLARALASIHKGGVSYVGQKGHTQKILTYVNKTRDADFTQAQMEELCQNLLDLEAFAPLRRFCEIGRGKFQDSPLFPYFQAMSYIRAKGRRSHNYQMVPLLQQAQRLAQAQPSNETRDRLLEDIEKHLHEANPFGMDLLGKLFERMTGMPDDFLNDNDDLL